MTMRPLLLTGFLFITCSFSGLFAQAEMAEVYKYCNATLVEDILDEKEIWFEEIQDDLYKIKLNGYNVSLLIDEGDIILRAYFSDLKPSLRTLNDFNAQYRWGRTYFDGDDDLTYGAELSFTGGVAEEGIHVFINTYGAVLDKLIDTVN